jgi:hypothetical protein
MDLCMDHIMHKSSPSAGQSIIDLYGDHIMSYTLNAEEKLPDLCDFTSDEASFKEGG